LLDGEGTRAEKLAAASTLGISEASIYRALKRYRLSRRTTDLPPPTRPGGRNKSRLTPKVEATIQETLERVLLNRRAHTISKFYDEAELALRAIGITVSRSTLRSRVAQVPSRKWMRAREGAETSRRTQEGVKGEHPPTSAPLEVVQIDHWQTDIYILDDAREHVIGRAWLTLIIDVHTRVIVGFHLGLDAPSTTTVGLAAVNMLTRKEAMLERHDIKFPWPAWGAAKRMHSDNGPDLASDSVESSAKLYDIKTTFRFVRQPQYGQYIERLNGTLAQRFRNLPGATGATAAERKKLRPEKTATFTLNDLEREVLLQIAEYHHDVHLGLGPITPMQKWTDHFFGPHGAKHPLPAAYADCLELRRDWFPRARPTLQRYGLRIDHLDYVNERLMDLIPEGRKLGRLEVRRDPFDIRQVYVQHPRTGEWMIVPTRHLGMLAASLFELREARRLALALKRAPKPDILIEIMLEQRAHRETARKATATAKRAKSKRAHHERIQKEADAADKRTKGRDELSLPAPASEQPQPKPDAPVIRKPDPPAPPSAPAALTRGLADALRAIDDTAAWADLDG